MVRGGRTCCEGVASSRLKQTVLMPACSIIRAISPTDWLQSGQTGMRMTAPTCSARRRRATSGAVRLSKGCVCGM